MYPNMMFWSAIPNLRAISNNCDLPPTIYALLNSYVNFSNDNPEKIKDLARTGRACIFDFEYPLATGWSKEEFECMILNHFLMRRIGYETVTAFKIALNVKLNEVMPNYNMLYDSIKSWNVFADGETITRTNTSTLSSIDTETSSNTVTNTGTSDQRSSDTPQNQISDVQNGSYVSNYEYDQTNETTNGTVNTSGAKNDVKNDNETITRSPDDKINIYQKFLTSKQNLYTMIFKDLDSLFYQIV